MAAKRVAHRGEQFGALLFRAFFGQAPLDLINQDFGFKRLSRKAKGVDGAGFVLQTLVNQSRQAASAAAPIPAKAGGRPT
jgi:hypothetical protein